MKYIRCSILFVAFAFLLGMSGAQAPDKKAPQKVER